MRAASRRAAAASSSARCAAACSAARLASASSRREWLDCSLQGSSSRGQLLSYRLRAWAGRGAGRCCHSCSPQGAQRTWTGSRPPWHTQLPAPPPALPGGRLLWRRAHAAAAAWPVRVSGRQAWHSNRHVRWCLCGTGEVAHKPAGRPAVEQALSGARPAQLQPQNLLPRPPDPAAKAASRSGQAHVSCHRFACCASP